MKRKNFLSSLLGAGALLPATGFSGNGDVLESAAILPRYLRAGDTIGITSPAGFITRPDIEPAIIQLLSWGFKVKIGNTIGKRDFGFGGTDDERRDDLQDMLDDPGIRAIMCARGGYGIVRIIDRLHFAGMVSHPKWIIGFSDITVLHSHLNRNFGIASIHSKMCNSFPEIWEKGEPVQKETILSIRDALTGKKMKYSGDTIFSNRKGIASGILVGGNLKTIETLAGTQSDLVTTGKVLFVEDTGEYLYSIDRMFWNLKRTGKLAVLKGLIIGGFKIKPDDPGEEFGKTVYDIVMEKVKKYAYPVCFDFPVGHQKNNFALKCGIRHKLEVSDHSFDLEEI
ncbi:MAG: LD-carboxypeptidase [Flavitalea sp.]